MTQYTNFSDIKKDDLIRIIYDGAPTELVHITKVRKFSLECFSVQGDFRCRITKVTDDDLRFYISTAKDRTQVLRPVRLLKVELETILS